MWAQATLPGPCPVAAQGVRGAQLMAVARPGPGCLLLPPARTAARCFSCFLWSN